MNPLPDPAPDRSEVASDEIRCYILTMRPHEQAGFTLLETLVALLVLGFLITGLVQGLRLGVTAWQVQSRKLAEQSDIESADRTLRELIARMYPGGFGPQRPTFAGTSGSLTFTTTFPEPADARATREADVTLIVDENHRLDLDWLPHYRNRIGPQPRPERVVLGRNVDHLEIAYWRTSQTGWQTDWTERTLPKLIRIRAVPMHDKHHPAADIVIAPMRDRWRQ